MAVRGVQVVTRLVVFGPRDLRPTWAETHGAIRDACAALNIRDALEIVSGGARGVDRAGEEWADSQGMEPRIFPADWPAHGNAAGPIRNAEMAAYADAGLCIKTNVQTKGTTNMLEQMRRLGKPVYVHEVRR
jgi:hypothetical protein